MQSKRIIPPTSALPDILTQVLGTNKRAQFCAHPGVAVVVLGNAVDE